MARGGTIEVVVQGLAPGRGGHLLQQGRALPPAGADAKGVLRLASEPINAETSLELQLVEPAFSCLISIARA